MAEEVEMTPVEMTPVDSTEPPKANPLAKPAAHSASSTLKLQPVARAAGAPLPTGGLKPGLKLPPKPGLPTATGLKPGLKLPPKPGMPTVAGLKPGLKLPPKPGLPTATGLKPGVNLPARPVIRKPGSTAAVSPLLRKPALAAPVAAAPEAPVAAAAPAPAPEQGKPLEALKSITNNLKSVTAPIPQQAILRKTGIIGPVDTSDIQKQAAKSKTSRISLADAMGAAPVKNEMAPMKTIRIKRPIDIPGATGTLKPLAPSPSSAPVTPAPESSAPAAPVPAAAPSPDAQAPSVSVTQRKTLKISRPGARPTGKFGVKKPSPAVNPAPAGEGGAAPAGEAPVADVADIPEMPAGSAPAPRVPTVAAGIADVPKGVAIMGLIVQVAACVAIGALAWFLYQDTQISPF